MNVDNAWRFSIFSRSLSLLAMHCTGIWFLDADIRFLLIQPVMDHKLSNVMILLIFTLPNPASAACAFISFRSNMLPDSSRYG